MRMQMALSNQSLSIESKPTQWLSYLLNCRLPLQQLWRKNLTNSDSNSDSQAPSQTTTYHSENKNPLLHSPMREVWCPRCKTYGMTDLVAPECGACGATCITVLYSIMDGTRLTGNDELAQRDMRPTQGARKP